MSKVNSQQMVTVLPFPYAEMKTRPTTEGRQKWKKMNRSRKKNKNKKREEKSKEENK